MIGLKHNSKSFLLTKSTTARSTGKEKSPTVSSQKNTQSVFTSYTQSFTYVRSNGGKIKTQPKSPVTSSSPGKKFLLPSAQTFSLVRPVSVETLIESDSPVIFSNLGEIILPSAESFTLTRSVRAADVLQKDKTVIESKSSITSISPGKKFFLPNTESFSLTGSSLGDLGYLFAPNPHSFIPTGSSLHTATLTTGEPLNITSVSTDLTSPDDKRRLFLKAAAVAGVGLAGTLLLPKKAEAFILGSSPTTGVVGVKDSTNTRINPATEETLDTVLKTTDLSLTAGVLDVNVTSAPSSSTGFSDVTDVAKSALVDADRHVQVDVLSSALPAAASTENTLETISFGGYKFTVHYDETGGTYDYLGEAAIGTATSVASWRIKRIDNSSGITVLYADTGVFDQVWDDRTTLSYS